MTNGNDVSQEAQYDEIVSKLEALLQKHKRKSSATMAAAGGAAAYPSSITGSMDVPLTANDNIPTLTETVHITPAMLLPQSDITSLLGQILDSALNDAGVDLDPVARKALVHALESHLFGL
ncbi:hypothetical protein [Nitrosovibrio tenuis]|uniref:Uncharacterized protein n=1 Tax=Nitrosovibrio tenuis TaxID=1233 RepID=A0A1H7H6K5_9PROT|nr:hypothetical protein [Nitrosovibrio tenuis]SEK46063.1 hypothetical protein SAMN05216387_101487 [Nitrosovibrio tenuis]